jgi:hypothetical protein
MDWQFGKSQWCKWTEIRLQQLIVQIDRHNWQSKWCKCTGISLHQLKAQIDWLKFATFGIILHQLIVQMDWHKLATVVGAMKCQTFASVNSANGLAQFAKLMVQMTGISLQKFMVQTARHNWQQLMVQMY